MQHDYSAHDGSGAGMPIEERMADELARLRKNLADILHYAGEPGVCNGPNCKQGIILMRHMKTGAVGRYNLDGSSHWATCVDREMFRRKKTYGR